ncbi:unnamed protein product [Moneuplotes crassus]|uniref:Uncharacterized protein n=1 Tax=Euplotes crassus TaxID=5936 RepID=A0AAD1YAA1_EUPCR|nr:unnamed protein product [Moneuplotes crassus]
MLQVLKNKRLRRNPKENLQKINSLEPSKRPERLQFNRRSRRQSEGGTKIEITRMSSDSESNFHSKSFETIEEEETKRSKSIDNKKNVNISEIIVINLFQNGHEKKNNSKTKKKSQPKRKTEAIERAQGNQDKRKYYEKQATILKVAKEKVNSSLQQNIDYLNKKSESNDQRKYKEKFENRMFYKENQSKTFKQSNNTQFKNKSGSPPRERITRKLTEMNSVQRSRRVHNSMVPNGIGNISSNPFSGSKASENEGYSLNWTTKKSIDSNFKQRGIKRDMRIMTVYNSKMTKSQQRLHWVYKTVFTSGFSIFSKKDSVKSLNKTRRVYKDGINPCSVSPDSSIRLSMTTKNWAASNVTSSQNPFQNRENKLRENSTVHRFDSIKKKEKIRLGKITKEGSTHLSLSTKRTMKNSSFRQVPYSLKNIKKEAESHLHDLYMSYTPSRLKILDSLSSHDSRERKNNFLKHLINNSLAEDLKKRHKKYYKTDQNPLEEDFGEINHHQKGFYSKANHELVNLPNIT